VARKARCHNQLSASIRSTKRNIEFQGLMGTGTEEYNQLMQSLEADLRVVDEELLESRP